MPSPESQVAYVDLARQFQAEREELMGVIETVLASGKWVGGDAVDMLEAELALRIGVDHAIAVGSGTDALVLGLWALGIGAGDEVITPPNSFVSSTSAIVRVGATPVFADVADDQNLDPEAIEAKISPRTRAIMPVHLTGHCADMPRICALAQAHGVYVIEDAAQAFGANIEGTQAGAFGHVGCFSAHPLKNLNACGDAGFVTSNDGGLARRVRALRNNGMLERNVVREWGTVSRLDSLQAAILSYRLTRVDAVTETRRDHAGRYRELLAKAPVDLPIERPGFYDVYHTFVVQSDDREALRQHLQQHGVSTGVHYPTPIHLQPAAHALGHRRGDFPNTEAQAARILSLPIHQHLEAAQIDRVAQCIREFHDGRARPAA